MSKVKQNRGGFVGAGIKEKPPRRAAFTGSYTVSYA
jgi:hypothetical protein